MAEMEKKKTDEELVLLAKNGNQQATEELFLRHAGLVRRCTRGFFLVGGETEDLIQEGLIGFYNAILNYGKTDKASSFKTFATLCVSRRVIDAVKKAASKKNEPLNAGVFLNDVEWMLPELNVSPEDFLISSDERKEFRRKMSSALSDFEFKIITMYVEGMTSAEICEATGKSAKSVDNAIQRSKKKLQQILKK